MDISTPLKPAVFHILLALAGGESYGYAIMQAVREQSGGSVPLQTGSFYRHLARMIEAGWVAETDGPRTAVDSRRGTHYRLTSAGRAALDAEKRRLSALVAPGAVRAATRRRPV